VKKLIKMAELFNVAAKDFLSKSLALFSQSWDVIAEIIKKILCSDVSEANPIRRRYCRWRWSRFFFSFSAIHSNGF
jgi:hypothetical protein